MSNTQNHQILKHLKYAPITPKEAMTEYGIYRLSARIFDLRHQGHVIQTERTGFKNPHTGIVSQVARYVLKPRGTRDEF